MNLVIEKLTQIVELSRAQAHARENDQRQLAYDLDRELDNTFAEKERAVGAWQQHAAEHGC
jgi:hypothetical protein